MLRGIESIYSFKINSAESDKDKKLLAVGDELPCKDNQIIVRNESSDFLTVEFANDNN